MTDLNEKVKQLCAAIPPTAMPTAHRLAMELARDIEQMSAATKVTAKKETRGPKRPKGVSPKKHDAILAAFQGPTNRKHRRNYSKFHRILVDLEKGDAKDALNFFRMRVEWLKHEHAVKVVAALERNDLALAVNYFREKINWMEAVAKRKSPPRVSMLLLWQDQVDALRAKIELLTKLLKACDEGNQAPLREDLELRLNRAKEHHDAIKKKLDHGAKAIGRSENES